MDWEMHLFRVTESYEFWLGFFFMDETIVITHWLHILNAGGLLYIELSVKFYNM